MPEPVQGPAGSQIHIPDMDRHESVTLFFDGPDITVTAGVTFTADISRWFPADAVGDKGWFYHLDPQEWLPEDADFVAIISAALFMCKVDGLDCPEYLRQHAERVMNETLAGIRERRDARDEAFGEQRQVTAPVGVR